MSSSSSQTPTTSPPPHTTSTSTSIIFSPSSDNNNNPLDDLQQLEILQNEAERMKNLGNKHMSQSSYTRAYNAYSAALQLSPVGPNSHIYLSNRSASLLSLRHYSAAAVDARRAVALKEDFGKGYARLGQASYFLKDYEVAVESFEMACRLEPGDEMMRVYLEKSRRKLGDSGGGRRVEEQHRRVVVQQEEEDEDEEEEDTSDDDSSSSSSNSSEKQSSSQQPLTLTTAPSVDHSISSHYSSSSFKQPNTPSQLSSSPTNNNTVINPDYDESTRLFSIGNSHLPKKQYRHAIESYTAALFLTPDDPTLSPYLYLARAEAYNALGRHSSAADDARKGIALSPRMAGGYGMLGRTLFYLGDWRGCVIALEECAMLTKESGVGAMDVYDCAFLQKAQVELSREISERVVVSPTSGGDGSSVVRVVPKLPPPRFVPRETAMGMSSSIPPMPSNWPTQSHSSTTPLRLGPDRIISFGEGPMGIKLNRGSDGIIRVLSVQNACIDPSSGLTITPHRQGLMNPGDVVREAAGVDLRRPVTNIMWGDTVALIKMAKRPIELIVAKELSLPPKSVREELERELVLVKPSPASTEDPVLLEEEEEDDDNAGNDLNSNPNIETETEEEESEDVETDEEETHADPPPLMDSAESQPCENADPSSLDDSLIMVEPSDIPPPPLSSPNPPQAPSIPQTILFPPSLPYTTTSFNNPQAPPRLIYHSPIMKHTPTLFFPNNYTRLTLALYSHPPILLLLRPPSSTFEIKKLHPAHPSHPTIESYLIVDTCYILHTLKLQLSHLTTPTSPPSTHASPTDPRHSTVFSILAPPPLENTILSTMIRPNEDISDSSIVQLETSLWEQLLKKAICDVHGTTTRHDAIRGTVHSHIMERSVENRWITALNQRSRRGGDRLVDQLDEGGWSALHWACHCRYVEGVQALVVKCGANGGIMTPEGRNALHMASQRLDAESLEILLSEGGMDPNVLDEGGDSSLTIVLAEGTDVGGVRDVDLIRECALVLRGWGGRVVRGTGSVDLVHDLAERWEGHVLGVCLEVRKWCYPLSVDMSNGGCFHYPMHAVMEGLKRRCCEGGDDNEVINGGELLVTIQILLRYGFETNERCEGVPEHPHLDKWFGLTPLHLLGKVAKAMRVRYEELQVNYAENIDAVVKLHGLFDTISQAALLLCAHGARVALPMVCAPRLERRVPVKLRPDCGRSSGVGEGHDDNNEQQPTGGRRGNNSSSSSSSSYNKTTDNNSDEEQELNLSDLFGSPTQLKDTQKKYMKLPPAEKFPRQIIHAKEKKDSPFPGGSDEKSCFICWIPFGMIMQRRHRCRVTNHYVCEECSGKRVIVDGKEHRVSDGQYNLARLMTEAEELSKRQEQRLLRQKKIKSQHTKPAAAAATTTAMANAKDLKLEHDKDELFSGIRKSMEGFFKSEEVSSSQVDEPPTQAAKKGAPQMGELVNSLSQTRDALNERGEKLNSLGDKTDKLKNQASDFAQMAKELRESQEGGMFGFW